MKYQKLGSTIEVDKDDLVPDNIHPMKGISGVIRRIICKFVGCKFAYRVMGIWCVVFCVRCRRVWRFEDDD